MLGSDVTVKGSATVYETRGASGAPVHRHFCTVCGNSVFNLYPAAAESISLNAALLDDPAVFQPQIVLFTSEALPWD